MRRSAAHRRSSTKVVRARRSVIPIFIPHLGCPCHCVFCNQRSITAAGSPSDIDAAAAPAKPAERRSTDAAHVAAMIEEGLARAGDGAELAFYGGSFTAICADLRRSFLEAADPFVKSGRISSVRVSTRPDAIDAEILDELYRYGVRTVELGAQSMDDRVLALSKRGHTSADTIAAASLIREKGIALILQMMVSLPGEVHGSAVLTAKKLAELKPDGVRIYPVAVIRNTELERLWKEGKYIPLALEEAVDTCADLIDIFEAQGIAVIRVGLNPSDELERDVLAGVYHPAFGELCRSRLLRREAVSLLSREEDIHGKTVILGVSRGKVSMLVGQRRHNLEMLKNAFCLKEIKIRETDPKDVNHDTGDTGKVSVEILDIY